MTRRPVVASALSALLLAACMRTITEEMPTRPNPTEGGNLAPLPVVVIPVPIPTPNNPAPTPTPANPAPAPAPTAPAPAPAPAPNSPLRPGETPSEDMVRNWCSPWIPPEGYDCPRSPDPQFVTPLTAAVMKLQAEQPTIFRGSLVLDAVAYYNGVFRNLYDLGYCAVVDSNEVAISQRGDATYRENYQILSSAGMVRRSALAHTSACRRR